ncbi:MAG: Gldg family protein [Promethearchaeota archaeon]
MGINEEYRIVFDEAHNNSVEIETSAYGTFIDYLFQQGIKIGRISKEITWKKIKEYDLLILGDPQNLSYSLKEIYTCLEFIKNGGNILIFSDEGGDVSNQTNLNELLGHFGLKILPNIVFDMVSNAGKEVHPVIKKFNPHPITNDVFSIVLASGCSFELLSSDEFELMDVSVKPVAFSSLTAKTKVYKERQWAEESGRNSIVIAAGRYYKGRFVCLSTPSILSSLSSNYGLQAKDNQKLMQNILYWLLEEREDTTTETATLFGDEVEVLVRIKENLWNWTRSVSAIGEWGDFSSIVNHALKLLRKTIRDKQKQLEEDRTEVAVESEAQVKSKPQKES